jgi:hypothetical protein
VVTDAERSIADAIAHAEAELAATDAALLKAEREAGRRFRAGNFTRVPSLRDLSQRRSDLEATMRGLRQLAIVETYGGLLAEIDRASAELVPLREEYIRLGDPEHFKPPIGWSTANELLELQEAPHRALAATRGRVGQIEAYVASREAQAKAMREEHGELIDAAARD